MRISITTNRALNRELDPRGRSVCQISGSRVFTQGTYRPSEIDEAAGVSLTDSRLPFQPACHTQLAARVQECRLLPLLAGPGPRWPELPAATAGHTHTTPAPLPGPSSAQIAALGIWNAKQRKKVRDRRQFQANNHLRILPIHALSDLSLAKSPPPCPPHSYSTRRPSRGYAKSRSGSPTGGRLANCRVYRGGVKRCGSTSAPARVSKMSSSRTWARWAPSRCMSAFSAAGSGVIG